MREKAPDVGDTRNAYPSSAADAFVAATYEPDDRWSWMEERGVDAQQSKRARAWLHRYRHGRLGHGTRICGAHIQAPPERAPVLLHFAPLNMHRYAISYKIL